mgnify:CR=1 FL=1
MGVANANEEMQALDDLDTKTTAVLLNNDLKKSGLNLPIKKDSLATISLKANSLNKLVYASNTNSDQFAVFSEIYAVLYKGYASFLSDSSTLKPLVKHLQIVDLLTISLFSDVLRGVGRNPINGKRKAVKMHTIINAMEGVPCLISFTSAATHDHTFLKHLKLENGFFVVFDKAYNDYL